MANPAVVDTNVFVSGLISKQSDSPPCEIVDEMLVGGFPFLLSLDLLTEYRTVLLRPKIKKLHGLTEKQVDTILTAVTVNGMMRDPNSRPTKGLDPGDQPIWDLLGTYPKAVLVTGDRPLRVIVQKKGLALSSQEFVKQVLQQSG